MVDGKVGSEAGIFCAVDKCAGYWYFSAVNGKARHSSKPTPVLQFLSQTFRSFVCLRNSLVKGMRHISTVHDGSLTV